MRDEFEFDPFKTEALFGESEFGELEGESRRRRGAPRGGYGAYAKRQQSLKRQQALRRKQIARQGPGSLGKSVIADTRVRFRHLQLVLLSRSGRFGTRRSSTAS